MILIFKIFLPIIDNLKKALGTAVKNVFGVVFDREYITIGVNGQAFNIVKAGRGPFA